MFKSSSVFEKSQKSLRPLYNSHGQILVLASTKILNKLGQVAMSIDIKFKIFFFLLARFHIFKSQMCQGSRTLQNINPALSSIWLF